MPTQVAVGQLTIVDVNDGLSASLTNNSAVLAADSAGTVASFAGAETSFKILEAGVDTTNQWSFYVGASGGSVSYRDSDDTLDKTGVGIVDGGLGGENLLTYSQQFDVASWVKTSSTITPNSTVAPDGTMTAATMTGGYVYSATAFTDASVYTFSLYVKAVSAATQVSTRVDRSGQAQGNQRSTPISANAWTRVVLTVNPSIGGNPVTPRIDTVDGPIYIWGAQIERGGSASEYAPTVAAARTGTRGYVKVTALSADLSYLDIVATKVGGSAITRRFSLAKTKTGIRGTITTSAAIAGSAWVDASANSAISTAGGGAPIAGDVVTLYNSAAAFSQTRVYTTTGVWNALAGFFGGNVLVDGTLLAAKLAAATITGDKIAANTISADKMVANTITAGQIAAGAIGTDQLAANAIIASKIKAGEVSIEKLAIGRTEDSLIQNSGAETGDTTGWRCVEGSGTIAASTADKATGAYSFLCTRAAQAGYGAVAIPVQPGERYNVRFKVKGATATGTGLYMLVEELNTALPVGASFVATMGNTGEFAQRTSNTNLVNNGAFPNVWTTYDFVYTVPAGVMWVSPAVHSWTNGPASFYFDDFEFRRQVETTMIEDGAITTGKITVGAVDADRLAANSVSAVKIAAGAIETDKLAANAVTSGKISAGAVTATQIASNAITTDKLGANVVTANKLAIGTGANQVANAGCHAGSTGWFQNGTLEMGVNWGGDGTWNLQGANTIYLRYGGTAGPNSYLHMGSATTSVGAMYQFAVSVGKTYEAHAYVQAHRCEVQLFIQWLNESDGNVGSTNSSSTSFSSGHGRTLDAYQKIGCIGVAPAGACRAQVFIRKGPTTSGSDSYLFCCRGFFAETVAGATELQPWSLGGVTMIEGGYITANAITADKIASRTITSSQIAANAISAYELAANSVIAGKIAAGAISATEIQSGAITAGKIAIGDLENLVYNGMGNSNEGWAGNVVDEGSFSGYWNGVGVTSNFALTFRGRDSYFGGVFAVKSGEQYFCSFDATPTGGTTRIYSFALGFIVWGQDGSTVTGFIAGASLPTSGSGFGHSEGYLTIPSNAAFARVWVQVDGSDDFGTAGKGWHATNMKVRRMNGGELIVDGSITAGKIAANTITAGQIAAGTITATQLAANSITASQISAGAIDGKTITGALVRTSGSGRRVELIAGNELRYYDANNVEIGSIGIRGTTDYEVARFGTTAAGNEASDAIAVSGYTRGYTGVYGQSSGGGGGAGVRGSHTGSEGSGYGVAGSAVNGVGGHFTVTGTTGGYGVYAGGGPHGAICFGAYSNTSSAAPTHVAPAGTVALAFVSGTARLYLQTAGGSTGTGSTWQQL